MLKLQFINQDIDPIWVVDKSFSIGNADDNHLVLDDTSVSLQHARIMLTNKNYHLKDLGSQDGSYINEKKVTQQQLSSGDIIRLGTTSLKVIDPLTDKNHTYWSLVACSSWLTGQEFPIVAKSGAKIIKIGRSSHCDIIFPGTHLSREHIEVVVNDDALLIRDLDSANGTFINDKRINSGELHSGDLLRLDVYSFKVFGPYKEPAPLKIKQQEAPSKPDKPRSHNPKDWKVRSTSPGNRIEKEPSKVNGIIMLVTAGILSLTLIGLGFYLFGG